MPHESDEQYSERRYAEGYRGTIERFGHLPVGELSDYLGVLLAVFQPDAFTLGKLEGFTDILSGRGYLAFADVCGLSI